MCVFVFVFVCIWPIEGCARVAYACISSLGGIFIGPRELTLRGRCFQVGPTGRPISKITSAMTVVKRE